MAERFDNAVALSGGRVVRFGVGTPVGEAVGASITKLAPLAGPAAPVVAAVGAIVSVIASFFGGGCGQACIESAQLEQVPEVALDDLYAVTQQQPGAISASEFESAWQNIVSYGVQQLEQLQQHGDAKAQSGISNLQKSTDYSAVVASLPANPTVALDVNRAQSVFKSPSASGWYPQSIAAGNQLALAILNQMSSGGAGGVLGGISAATGLPSWALLAGVGLVAVVALR